MIPLCGHTDELKSAITADCRHAETALAQRRATAQAFDTLFQCPCADCALCASKPDCPAI